MALAMFLMIALRIVNRIEDPLVTVRQPDPPAKVALRVGCIDISILCKLLINKYKHCHPERNWERFLLPMESKDLRFACAAANPRQKSGSPAGH
jgi:hypothetical protein